MGSMFHFIFIFIEHSASKQKAGDLDQMPRSTESDLNRHWLYMSHKMNARLIYEPVHEISNNLVYATSKASDQPTHTRSLIRAFASRLSIL